MSVYEAASSGNERRLLCELRDTIASTIDDGIPARDLAALSKRLMEIQGEIAVIDAQEDEDGGGVVDTPDEEWDGSF